jgi:hypothetical protein
MRERACFSLRASARGLVSQAKATRGDGWGRVFVLRERTQSVAVVSRVNIWGCVGWSPGMPGAVALKAVGGEVFESDSDA